MLYSFYGSWFFASFFFLIEYNIDLVISHETADEQWVYLWCKVHIIISILLFIPRSYKVTDRTVCLIAVEILKGYTFWNFYFLCENWLKIGYMTYKSTIFILNYNV